MIDLISDRLRLRTPSRQTVAEWLLRGVDLGILGAFLLTALVLGGRHDAGRLVYAASVALAALCLTARAALLRRPLETPAWPLGLAFCAIAVPMLQLIPLPAAAHAWVAPGHAQLLPMWSDGSSLGRWSTVSLAPSETIEAIVLLSTHALLFLVLINRLRKASDARRLFGALGVVAVVMAGLAVLQSLRPNGKLLWVYDYAPYWFGENVQGTFANKNHLAHFLTFGVAASAIFFFGQRTERRSHRSRTSRSAWPPQTIAGLAAIVFLLVTAMATMSRGGVAALAIGLLVAILTRWLVGGFKMSEAIGLVAIGSAVLVAVSSYDYERVTNRLDDLVSGQIEQLDAESSRRLIWEANAEAFLANPWLGHGAGSHRAMYAAYIDSPTVKEYTHAESGYLQVASECGSLGLLVLCLALGSAVWWVTLGLRAANTPEKTLLGSALAGGLAASVAHSFVDFVWYVPSLCALAIAFAAVAYRSRELFEAAAENPSPSRRHAGEVSWWRLGSVAVVAPAAVVCLMGPALGSLSWDRYLRVSKTTIALRQEALASPDEQHSNQAATIRESDARAFRLLTEVLQADPNNARANARFANRCVLAFGDRVAEGDNPMTLDLIRDAAVNGGFDSVQEVRDWVRRAFGDSAPLLARSYRHAQATVSLCPLEASAYLQCAGLAFLSDDRAPLDHWLEQAIRLRPHDGGVRYEAARLLHASGRFDEALEHYRASIRLPGSHRYQLVATLATLMPAKVFLESLQPDMPATEITFAAYQMLGAQEDLLEIAQHAEAATRSLEDAEPHEIARCWRQLSTIYRAVERYDEAVECALRAQEHQPYDFWVRHALALAMSRAEQFEQAEPHLRWCLARRPDLHYLKVLLGHGSKKRSEAERVAREKKRFEDRLASLRSVSQSPGDTPASNNPPSEQPVE